MEPKQRPNRFAPVTTIAAALVVASRVVASRVVASRVVASRVLATAVIATMVVATVVGPYASPAAAVPLPPAWQSVAIPDPPAASSPRLISVSCTSPTACIAVGSTLGVAAGSQTVATRWDGTTWQLMSTPNAVDSNFSVFTSVSCASPDACTAVGSQRPTGSNQQALIETWDGSAWHIVPLPMKPSVQRVTTSVSCPSVAFCMVVGTTFDNTPGQGVRTLTEMWDGAAWQVLPSPNTSTAASNYLFSVACVSSSACTAVGYSSTTPTDAMPLIEVWNGSAWTIVAGATMSDKQTRLSSVSCTSVGACLAVGGIDGQGAPAIESWNGSSWQVVASPALPNAPGSSFAASVSCVSASACTILTALPNSWLDAANGLHDTSVETWNGSSVQVKPTTAANDTLLGISCIGTDFCAAVGTAMTGPVLDPVVHLYAEMLFPAAHRVCTGTAICPGALQSKGSPPHVQLSSTRQCRANTVVNPLPTTTTGLPATVVGQFIVGDAANVETFVVGIDANVYHNYLQANGVAAGWSSLSGPAAGIYTSVRNGRNYLGNQELYVRGNDGQVYHNYATPGRGSGWQGWDPMGAPASGIAGDVYEGTNFLHNQELYVLGNDGDVYHHFSTPEQGTGWSGWDTLGHPAGVTVLGDMQFGVNYLCNQEVYVTGTDGNIYHSYSTPGQGSGWSAWSSLGQPALGAGGPVSVGENPQGNQDLFVVGTDGSIYRNTSTPGQGSGWSGWSLASTPQSPLLTPFLMIDSDITSEWLTFWTTIGEARSGYLYGV